MSFLRLVGLACLLAVFAASGYMKIVSPKDSAALLSKSNFPELVAAGLKYAGLKYKLTPADYVLIIQVTGGIFVSFSAFILLNVGRQFFSFLLAVGLAIITVCFHINLSNPAATEEAQQIQVMKNLAIIGGLLFVAGSGRVRRVPAVTADSASKKAKKSQ